MKMTSEDIKLDLEKMVQKNVNIVEIERIEVSKLC